MKRFWCAEFLYEIQPSVCPACNGSNVRCARLRRYWRLIARRARRGPVTNWKHALSGDVKYPDGFKHFDYVNPNAPQGGTVRQIAFGTFDNFNTVVSGVKGSIALGTELFMETLMTPALDEVSTEYGLLAEAASHPDDHSSVTYRLNAKARWHDGKPVTADDVVYSFDIFRTNSPFYGTYYRHVTKVENGIEITLRSMGRAIASCRRSSASCRSSQSISGRCGQIGTTSR